jgi:hypothetical protein
MEDFLSSAVKSFGDFIKSLDAVLKNLSRQMGISEDLHYMFAGFIAPAVAALAVEAAPVVAGYAYEESKKRGWIK